MNHKINTFLLINSHCYIFNKKTRALFFLSSLLIDNKLERSSMLKKKSLVICLGSSCFARGNKHLVQEVRKYLEEHKLNHRIDFKGKHCFGNCENGPAIQIDDQRIDHINTANIKEILDKELLNKPWD